MMGLDILTNNSAAPHSEPADPNGSSSSTCASSQNNLTQNKQENRTNDLLEACPGVHGSTQVGAVAGCSGSRSAKSEVPILQPQEEGELTDILDHFLQSFEQHIYNCSAREKKEMDGESVAKASQPGTVLSKYSKTKTQTITSHASHIQNTRRVQPARHSQTTTQQQSDKAETQSSRSQTRKAAARRGVPPKRAGGASGKVRSPTQRQKKRRTNQYMFSLEKKKRKPVSSTDRKPRIFPDRDKQLQQMPVVRLERSGPLPVKVTLQGRCQSREVKVTKTS